MTWLIFVRVPTELLWSTNELIFYLTNTTYHKTQNWFDTVEEDLHNLIKPPAWQGGKKKHHILVQLVKEDVKYS